MFVLPVNPIPQRPAAIQSISMSQRFDHCHNRILPSQRFKLACRIPSYLEDQIILGILESQVQTKQVKDF
jgi:hypothetical protein